MRYAPDAEVSLCCLISMSYSLDRNGIERDDLESLEVEIENILSCTAEPESQERTELHGLSA